MILYPPFTLPCLRHLCESVDQIHVIVGNELGSVFHCAVNLVCKLFLSELVSECFQVIKKDFQMRVKGSGKIPCGFASGGFRCIEKLLVLPFPVISIKAEFVVVCTCRCIVGRLIKVYKLEYSQLIVYVVA